MSSEETLEKAFCSILDQIGPQMRLGPNITSKLVIRGKTHGLTSDYFSDSLQVRFLASPNLKIIFNSLSTRICLISMETVSVYFFQRMFVSPTLQTT
jgi:hypothetical protein